VIDRNALPNNQLVLLDIAGGVVNSRRGLARRWLASLLATQASSTLWWGLNLAAMSVKAASLLQASKDSRAHQSLNLAKTKKMPEWMMPTK
jgi:hypothetical protein